MKYVLLSIFLNIVLCIIYIIFMNMINLYSPLEHWNISFTITFKLSIVVLFITLVLAMIIILYIKNKYIILSPIFLLIFYWLDIYQILPIRSIMFLILNIIIYSIYCLFVFSVKNRILKPKVHK